MEHELYMDKLSHIPLKLVVYEFPYTTDFSGIWDNFSIYNESSILFMINITSTRVILVVYGTICPYTTIFLHRQVNKLNEPKDPKQGVEDSVMENVVEPREPDAKEHDEGGTHIYHRI